MSKPRGKNGSGDGRRGTKSRAKKLAPTAARAQRASTRGASRAAKGRSELAIVPATPDRWGDLERLFGERGACGGCWCMLWRLTSAAFEAGKGAENRAALRKIVSSGEEPGVLAYDGARAIGWCAVAPRATYVRLEKSRVLAPLDQQPVWSISCLFVLPTYRRRGVSVALARGAAEHARRHGARWVEAYPIAARVDNAPPPFVWTGLPETFERAGFIEVARRSATRPIFRLALDARRG